MLVSWRCVVANLKTKRDRLLVTSGFIQFLEKITDPKLNKVARHSKVSSPFLKT
jgi:hypothetical protein